MRSGFVNVQLSARCCASAAIFACIFGWSPAHADDAYAYSRSSSFTYFQVSDGAKAGLLQSETVESATTQQCVTTTYDYDAYGNRKTSTTANCAGATGNALFASRTSATTYATQTVTVAGVAGVVIPAGAFATTSTNALSQSDNKTYDPRFGGVTSLTGPNALVTNWTLDDFGRVITETRADGTRSFNYFCYITGRVSDTSSNSANCPTSFAAGEIPTDAVAFVHSESHDNASSPAGGNKNGPFSRVYTDRAGRKIRTVTEAFDGAGQPGGTSRLIIHDADYSPYGPQIIATQPYFLDSGSSTSTGNSSTPYGMSLTAYDALGRPTVVYSTDVRVTGSNAGGSAPTITFGSRGSQQAAKTTVAYSGLNTTTTDDHGKTRLQERNVDGKVVRVTDALGAQVVYQYDAFGNLLTTKDALQNLVQLTYDTRGRKITMADPDAGVWGYCYDALGQLVAQQNSKMRGSDTPGTCPSAPNNGSTTANSVAGWTTMAYDVLGRMTSRVEPEYGTTWTYDKYADSSACNKGIGKLCEVSTTNNGIDRKTAYDSLGRPSSTRATITSGPSFASLVTYDTTSSRPVSQTYPTGLKVNYGYTTKGFLSSLSLGTTATVTPLPHNGGAAAAGATLTAGTASATLWQANAYNAWGRAEQSTYGNNVVNKAAFDASTGRLTSQTSGVSSATNVLNYTYAWDSISHVTQRNDANGDGSTGAVSDVLSYDDIGRLTGYTVNAASIPSMQRVVTLQYNALGMTLYKSDVGNYTYGAQNTAGVRPHALQSVSGAVTSSYTYDANGNLVTSSSGKYRTIAYTSFNLPDSNSGAQGPSGSPKYTWMYDENHQRVKEIEVSSAGTRTTWEMHPDNVGGLSFESESSTPSSPTPTNRHYLSVGGVSIGVLISNGALPTLATGVMVPPTITTSIALSKVEYWHKDQLGSLVATTDHLANVTARYSYDPFGKRRQASGVYDAFGTLVVDWVNNNDNGTDRGYTGHEHLDDIGIIHMNGRTYDPTLGRFMQGDPVIQDPSNLQNYDRYGYCYNNPLTCSDPSGYRIADVMKHLDPFGYHVHMFLEHSAIGRAWIQYEIYSGSAACGVWAAACYGAGETLNASLQGYSNSQATRTGLIAGATYYANQLAGNSLIGHALVGCVSAEASGQSCRGGAYGALVSTAYQNSGYAYQGNGAYVVNLVVSSAAGGLASLASGGSFKSGATQAAYSYLFTQAAPVAASGDGGGISSAGSGPADSVYGSKDPNFVSTGAWVNGDYDSSADDDPNCSCKTRTEADLARSLGRQLERLGDLVQDGVTGLQPGLQYSLRASVDGIYFDVRFGTTYLYAGDVWKYGETTQLSADLATQYRYSSTSLLRSNLDFVVEYVGNQIGAKYYQALKINAYVLVNGQLPPGNKTTY